MSGGSSRRIQFICVKLQGLFQGSSNYSQHQEIKLQQEIEGVK